MAFSPGTIVLVAAGRDQRIFWRPSRRAQSVCLVIARRDQQTLGVFPPGTIVLVCRRERSANRLAALSPGAISLPCYRKERSASFGCVLAGGHRACLPQGEISESFGGPLAGRNQSALLSQGEISKLWACSRRGPSCLFAAGRDQRIFWRPSRRAQSIGLVIARSDQQTLGILSPGRHRACLPQGEISKLWVCSRRGPSCLFAAGRDQRIFWRPSRRAQSVCLVIARSDQQTLGILSPGRHRACLPQGEISKLWVCSRRGASCLFAAGRDQRIFWRPSRRAQSIGLVIARSDQQTLGILSPGRHRACLPQGEISKLWVCSRRGPSCLFAAGIDQRIFWRPSRRAQSIGLVIARSDQQTLGILSPGRTRPCECSLVSAAL